MPEDELQTEKATTLARGMKGNNVIGGKPHGGVALNAGRCRVPDTKFGENLDLHDWLRLAVAPQNRRTRDGSAARLQRFAGLQSPCPHGPPLASQIIGCPASTECSYSNATSAVASAGIDEWRLAQVG